MQEEHHLVGVEVFLSGLEIDPVGMAVHEKAIPGRKVVLLQPLDDGTQRRFVEITVQVFDDRIGLALPHEHVVEEMLQILPQQPQTAQVLGLLAQLSGEALQRPEAVENSGEV